MDFHFDYSEPHPGKMGEIYKDQLYRQMSEIKWEEGDGRPQVDISKFPPLDLSRPDRIRVPDKLAGWKRKLKKRLTRKNKKGDKPVTPAEEQDSPGDESERSGEDSERSGEESGSSDNSLKANFSTLSLSIENRWKAVLKPFQR